MTSLILKEFECNKCGKCCDNQHNGTSTFLYLYDIERIAKFMNESSIEFLKKYTDIIEYNYIFPDKIVNSKRVALKNPNHCIFKNRNNLCNIHSAKPFICKYGPYINPIVSNVSEYKKWIKVCDGFKPIENKNREVKIERLIKIITEIQKHHEYQYFEYLLFSNDSISKYINNADVKSIINLKQNHYEKAKL